MPDLVEYKTWAAQQSMVTVWFCFSRTQIWTAGRPACTLCLWSHDVVVCADWDLLLKYPLTSWKRICFDGSMCLCEIPISASTSMAPSYPCHRHWWTPILSNLLLITVWMVFVLTTESQSIWHELRLRELYSVSAQNWCAASYFCKEFQFVFLNAASDCVAWQWFSKTFPRSSDYIHQSKMMISRVMLPSRSHTLA